MNFIDRVVAFFSPARGLRRLESRAELLRAFRSRTQSGDFGLGAASGFVAWPEKKKKRGWLPGRWGKS